MGRRIPFKILYYGMDNDQYHMRGDFDDTHSALFQYEKNLVHRINRFYFSKLTEVEFWKEIEKNWGVVIHDTHLVLFTLGATSWTGKGYTCIKGLVFEEKDIHVVWLNLREIIMLMKIGKASDRYVLEDDLYDLRRKQDEVLIPDEIGRFLRKDFIPQSFAYTNLINEIWSQIPDIFRVEPIVESECSTIISKSTWNVELMSYVQEYRDRYEKYGKLALEYEIPDVRKRPRQENYFKEKKKIKTDIKNRSANWRLHTIANQKHYVRWIEIPMDHVSCDELESFFVGLREWIDKGD